MDNCFELPVGSRQHGVAARRMVNQREVSLTWCATRFLLAGLSFSIIIICQIKPFLLPDLKLWTVSLVAKRLEKNQKQDKDGRLILTTKVAKNETKMAIENY